MQREHLYRGKYNNTEWVLGVPQTNPRGQTFICKDMMQGWDVDPDTVGQYYGHPDKNGNPIFEDDIIELVNADGDTIRVVCEYGTARREIMGNTVDIVGFYFKLPSGKKSFPIVNNYAGKYDLELFEVIGNIHDNPELLR